MSAYAHYKMLNDNIVQKYFQNLPFQVGIKIYSYFDINILLQDAESGREVEEQQLNFAISVPWDSQQL